MTYRSLLVFLDRDPLCAARTQVAMRMAQDFDCHLVGVAPTGVVELPLLAEAAVALAELSALTWKALREDAEQATQCFRSACRVERVKSFEAVVDESDKALSLVHHAHCSDLTVLTQADPTAPGHRLAQTFVEQVVLSSARPTLILPYAGTFKTIGSTAMVAWDDSREAARALSDALPFLRQAKQVQIVSWSESPDGEENLRQRLDALSKWLMWQGVSASLRVEMTDVDIADAMLSHAADSNADLLVMGAYGHARWSERVLGGATCGLLAAMTVPVLMSH